MCVGTHFMSIGKLNIITNVCMFVFRCDVAFIANGTEIANIELVCCGDAVLKNVYYVYNSEVFVQTYITPIFVSPL